MAPRKKEGNDYIYFTILIIFVTIAIGTFWHDPILHGIVALLNGWEIETFETGLMTGSTTVLASTKASIWSVWLYFMFPPIAIFVAVIIATWFKPDRLIMVAGIILMSMNLPSLKPDLQGSDAYNAIQYLVIKGWSELGANALHYILFITVLILWGLYLYVTVENNSRDAKARMKNIVQ